MATITISGTIKNCSELKSFGFNYGSNIIINGVIENCNMEWYHEVIIDRKERINKLFKIFNEESPTN